MPFEDINQSYESWYVVAAVGCLLVVSLLIEQKIKTSISSDILEHSDFEAVKDTARNLWVNITLVAALTLTLVVPMATTPPEDNQDKNGFLYQSYILSALISVAFCVKSIVFGVTCLMYVEPLKPGIPIARFLIGNPNSIGDSGNAAFMALVWMLFAICLYLWAIHGYVLGIFAIVIVLSHLALFVFYMRGKSQFNPETDEEYWSWPSLDVKDRPSWIATGEHQGFKNLYNKMLNEEKNTSSNPSP